MATEKVCFGLAEDEAARWLRREVANGASQADDTEELATAFLELRHYSCQDVPSLATQFLIAPFLSSLGAVYQRYVVDGLEVRPWRQLSRAEARDALLRLLTRGVACEPPVYDSAEGGANLFVERLFHWFGDSFQCATNMTWRTPALTQTAEGTAQVVASGAGFGVFKVGSCSDEGVVLWNGSAIGLVWFLGYD